MTVTVCHSDTDAYQKQTAAFIALLRTLQTPNTNLNLNIVPYHCSKITEFRELDAELFR